MNLADNFKKRLDRWTLKIRYKPGTKPQETVHERGMDVVYSTRRDARATKALLDQVRPDLTADIEKRTRL